MAYNYDDYIKPVNETIYDWNKLDDSGNAIGTQQTTYTNPNGLGNIDINGLAYQLYGNKLTRNDNGQVYQYDAIKNQDGTLGWNNYSVSNEQPDWYKDRTAQVGLALIGGAVAAPYMTGASAGAGATGMDFGEAVAAGTSGGGTASGAAVGGGAGGAAVNELGIPLEDIGDWSMDDWTKWATDGGGVGPPDMTGSPFQTGVAQGGSAAAAGGSYSLRDLWNDFNTGARTFTGNTGAGGNNGSMASLLAAYLQQQQQDKMGQQFLDMTKPYRDASTMYGQKLQQTYDDPSSYLNSPEYQSIAKTNLDLLNRQDSVRGNLANNIDRQAKMQQLAMSNLQNYRSGLAGIYNQTAGIGTGQGTQTGIALQGTQYSPFARWLGGN